MRLSMKVKSSYSKLDCCPLNAFKICSRKLEYPNELMAEVGVSEANNAESSSKAKGFYSRR